jgi:hypothetical protein
MRLVKWTRQRKGTLRGFADIELPIRLRFFGCPLHVAGSGRAWGSLGGKPQIGRDGQVIKIDGKTQYAPVAEWATSELRDAFSAALVELVRAHDAAALAPDSSPGLGDEAGLGAASDAVSEFDEPARSGA